MSNDEDATMSRRRFLYSAGALGAAAWLAPGSGDASAQRVIAGGLGPAQEGPVQQFRRNAATAPVVVHALRGNMRLLTGQGGNIVAAPGTNGVVLVDSGMVGPKVAASVATFTRVPIRHVISTHWHFDHTDANAWHAGRGATIVGHQNTRRRMSRATRVEDWNFTFPPSPAAALATTLVTTERSLRLNGLRVDLKYYGPAHTDTDISIHFTDADVLSVGDVWWNGEYPFIDNSTGGSIDGTIRAVRATLAMAGARTLIVPGHGPAAGRTELTAYRDMLTTVRERVAALKRQGRSADEAVAAKPTASFDARWGRSIIGGDFFTRLVYQGV